MGEEPPTQWRNKEEEVEPVWGNQKKNISTIKETKRWLNNEHHRADKWFCLRRQCELLLGEMPLFNPYLKSVSSPECSTPSGPKKHMLFLCSHEDGECTRTHASLLLLATAPRGSWFPLLFPRFPQTRAAPGSVRKTGYGQVQILECCAHLAGECISGFTPDSPI